MSFFLFGMLIKFGSRSTNIIRNEKEKKKTTKTNNKAVNG